jgi:ADP-ribose pyrophosphatase
MTYQVHHRRMIHRGRVFDVTVENVTLSNGTIVDLEIIRHPGAAAVVPLLDNDRVLMLKQYRHAVGGFLWEIPAGTFDGSEDPLTCARRELIEETGFGATKWETLGVITPVPGYSDEKIHLFMARDLTPAVQNLDQDEIIEVHTLPLAQVTAMITHGEIHDAKTVAGIFMAINALKALTP